MTQNWTYGYGCVLLLLVITLHSKGENEQFTNCGGDLSDQAGVISSPNFPASYPDNAFCQWHIEVAANQVIDVKFTRLDLDRYNDQNCVDYLIFYDGPTDQHPRIGYSLYCGYSDEDNTLNILLRSTGNQMLVAFFSDSMGSRTGFSASYRAHDCPAFTYGRDSCSTNCPCNITNADYCNSLTGQCMCNANWTGWDCSVLVNHCLFPSQCSDPYDVCVTIPGGYECRCKTGLTRNSTTGQCEDPKECTNKSCSHYCGVTSTLQETCYCPKGMVLNSTDDTQCIECFNWYYGDNCAYYSQCHTSNTESYDKANGLCHCYLNWTSTYCTEDFNECSFEKQPCVLEKDHASCFNTYGSFECRCFPGYEPVNETTCDECGKVLTETSGTIISGSHLEHLNSTIYEECRWTIQAPVGQVITLKFLSIDLYYWCYYGMINIYDGNDTNNTLIWNRQYIYNWNDVIVRTKGNEMLIIRYPASCYYGYYGYASRGFTASYWTHECPPNMYDYNCSTPCTCNVSNTNGYCNSITGSCSCKSGWTGQDCSVDIDECYGNYFLCPDYSRCHNLPGTYECRCKPGLVMNSSNICSNDDNSTECTSRNCSHICVNYKPENESSLIEACYCPIGQELEGDNCVACKNWMYGPDCELYTSCVREHTAYYDSKYGTCHCYSNWTGNNCEYDYNECDYGRYQCQPHSYCSNTYGGYQCICLDYYGYIETTPNTCEHIGCTETLTNETGIVMNYFYNSWFLIRNASCSWQISVSDGLVVSLRFSTFYLPTSYGCQRFYIEVYDGDSDSSHRIGRYCGSGIPSIIRSSGNHMFISFVSDDSDHYGNFYATYTSHTCRSFTYGKDSCNKSCRCVKDNTQFCDNINGECICKPGWTLGDCSTDVNECLGTNNKVCPENSDCINTKGSYICKCHLGYKLNMTTGKCEESSDCVIKHCSHSCYSISPGEEQCVCPDGLILDEETNLTCVVPYYPYGKIAGDSMLSDDYVSMGTISVSKPIQFSTGAPFGDQFLTSAFVLSNGVIGFSENIFSLAGATSISAQTDLNLIAPYMANINPNLGEVYFHLYEKFGNQFGDAQKQDNPKIADIFARAEKDIKKYYSLSSFKVNIVLLTTWANVQPFSMQNDSSEVNTFQAVYISGWETINIEGHQIEIDEESAYVIFLYQYGKMKWTYKPGRLISIGTTGEVYFNSLKDLNTPLVALLDRVPGNTGFNGVVSFEVGRVSGMDQTCNRYVCNNAELLKNGIYQYERNELYRCPCTLERLGNQWQLFEKRGADESIYCYIISPVAKRRLLRNNKRNELCCYKWIKPTSDDWREWLRTWREATYISASPESGHILPRDPWDSYWFTQENLFMHQMCCNYYTRDTFCKRFYKLFPDLGCSNFVPFILRSALGDPHITNLDGVTYTMNGWGEYMLLMIEKENLMLQCRTDRAEGKNGTLTNATIFTSFAVKESNESTFQVELSVARTSMVIMAGGIDVTSDFYKEIQPGIIVSSDTLSVTREYSNNKTMVVAGFPSGLSIKVYVAVKSLLIEVTVPKELQNSTQGLMGNFNGNISDDFTLPNGTVLSANISEREIYHHFAKAWAVNSSNSVFTYQPGDTTETYQHPEFEPFYRDEADPAALVKAKVLCGETDDACIFDYLVTNDTDFATTTKQANEETAAVMISLANSPPTIQIPNESLDSNGFWFVGNEIASTLHIIVDDEDGDNVTVEILGNITGVSVNKTGFITYIPDLKKPFLLTARAVDSKGSYSPDVYIPILICPNCNNHGTCDTKSVREEYESGKFKILSCACLPAYTGRDCESEVDGCANQPCFKGQTCSDLSAADQGNSTVGYVCGPCPTGYEAMMKTCVDIDECTNTKTCDHLCLNTEGSYVCSCRNGFRLDKTNNKSCTDINECEERSSNCKHQCINNEGNYTCACYTGYTLDADGFTCNIDETMRVQCYDCQQVCIAGENVTCGCKLGYELKPQSINDCQDVNECKLGNQPCNQVCNNLDGSYECSCFTGYKLASDKVSCTACETPYYGQNCASTCQCNGRGVCNPIRGCVCNENWTGDNCEVDVDECLQPTSCALGLVCMNIIGSFKCVCPSGYKMNNTQCTDINECTDPTVNTTCDLSVQICVNNIGSYSCECKKGYARNGAGVCIDIDECSNDIDMCEQSCENKPGSYNCLCYQGFSLDDDRKSCVKVKDPCASANINCSYGCRISSNEEKECFCPRGYNLVGQEKCEDINECASDDKNLCSNKNGCVNTNGSFACSCETGFKLDNDKRTCIECSSGTWGQNCATSCACGQGANHCDSKVGCICQSGYTGNYCEVDIDECKNGMLSCNSTETCTNLPGTAICKCQNGYERVNVTCQDINECSDKTMNDCSQVCTNLNGTFQCSCYAGYVYDDKTHSCKDIDECNLPTSKCEQLCLNTEGSYRCSCTTDLILQADGLTCRATLPCVNTTDCSYQCAVINGTDMCLCPKGQMLDKGGKTCKVCEPNYYGPSCTLACHCEANQECDNVDGSCYSTAINTTITTALPATSETITTALPATSETITTALPATSETITTVLPATSETITTALPATSETVTTALPATSETITTALPATSETITTVLPATSETITTALPATSETVTTTVNSHTSTIITCESANNICNSSNHETCVNRESGYECVCISGFMKLNNNSDCTEISSFNYTVTLNWDVPTKYLEDENSDDYKWLKNEIETQTLKRLREKSPNVYSVDVTKLRKGSVIAEYVIIMGKTVDSETVLSNAMNLIIKEGVELNGTTIFITNIINWNDACELKQKTAPCKSTEVCVVEGNTAVCRQVDSSEDKTELILGLAIGLPLFTLLCVVLVASILICKYLNKRKNKISQSSESLQSKALSTSAFQGYKYD